jgi:CRP-like cAMP-binding protein
LKFFVSMKTTANISSLDKAREEEYYVKRSGECFGDVDLFGIRTCSYSAVAIEDCDLFVLNVKQFEDAFSVNVLMTLEFDE